MPSSEEWPRAEPGRKSGGQVGGGIQRKQGRQPVLWDGVDGVPSSVVWGQAEWGPLGQQSPGSLGDGEGRAPLMSPSHGTDMALGSIAGACRPPLHTAQKLRPSLREVKGCAQGPAASTLQRQGGNDPFLTHAHTHSHPPHGPRETLCGLQALPNLSGF